jgi:hypothetical protein
VADAVSTPPRLTLNYQNGGTDPNLRMTVNRRLPGSSTWTTLASGLTNTTFVDTTIAVGQRYEYQVHQTAYGLIYGQIELLGSVDATPIENRGRILLIVEQAKAAALETNLVQLREDLVGDGWTVVQTNVPSHEDVIWANNPPVIQSIRQWIQTQYSNDVVNTKGVYLIGHVPISYSGFYAADGHTPTAPPDHSGAWPADTYYGDVDVVWNNGTSNYVNQSFPENTNLAGDGKFENDYVPGGLELFVGRVDFARMPTFTATVPIKSEIDLLKQYFDKAHKHKWRVAPYPLSERAIAWGSWASGVPGNGLDSFKNRVLYESGLRLASSLFGDPLTALSVGDGFLQKLRTYSWSLLSGPGYPDRISRDIPQTEHTTAWLKTLVNGPPIAFYYLYGSYFGDFNMVDDFMRASLATPTYGLAAIWGATLHFHAMASGETLGDGMRRFGIQTAGTYPRYLSIQGDPTLRTQSVPVPLNVSATRSGPDVVLSWTAPEPGLIYHVYWTLGGITNTFTRLNSAPLSGTSYTHSNATSALKTYMVRTLKRTVSGSGSYTNLSQGVLRTEP